MSRTHGQLPPALGNTTYPIGTANDGHSINSVIPAMEAQKKKDEETIKSIQKLQIFNQTKAGMTPEQIMAFWK
jgi:hypothetical protein